MMVKLVCCKVAARVFLPGLSVADSWEWHPGFRAIINNTTATSVNGRLDPDFGQDS